MRAGRTGPRLELLAAGGSTGRVTARRVGSWHGRFVGYLAHKGGSASSPCDRTRVQL